MNSHQAVGIPRKLSTVGRVVLLGLLLSEAALATDSSNAWLDSAVAALGAFRTIDGTDNNLTHPQWGSAGVSLLRHTTADYEDGVSAPAGSTRPSARLVSNAVAAQSASLPNAAGVTDFLWQWGQFLDHDLDLTGSATPPEPFDIPVPWGDPFFDPDGTGTQAILLNRSVYTMVGQPLVRQQFNQITAFIDASNVYGSDAERAAALRTLDGTGRLKTSPGRLLPLNVNGLPNAPHPTDPTLFLAGDVRANEQVGLTALHTVFVREHNWLARRFGARFPRLSGEQRYQLARAIVGAEMQAITYREFLPLLLGPDALAPYQGYNPSLNPGITTLFSTAAYRFGHSMLSPVLLRLKRNGRPILEGHLPLKEAFFAPQELLKGRGLEPLLRGLATQRAQEIDPFLVDAVRNFLFGPPGAGGFDLAALNIQRGRDHGLPSYNRARLEYGLVPVQTFADITPDPAVQTRLANVYAAVDEVDAWVGGLAENHVPGALVGELVFAVLTEQFEQLRDGDRFWYQRHLPPGVVKWVEQQTLARILRRNTQIGRELQANVFVVP